MREYSTSADRPDRSGGVEPAEGGATLSTAHIRPFVEWITGASVLKSSRGLTMPAVGGGKRTGIKGFSADSRRRLLFTVGSVDRSAPLPCFITLTWPAVFPSAADSKRQLAAWVRRMHRKFPQVGMIWKLEPQERGAPHYHLMAWGASEQDLQEFVPLSWYAIAGGGDQWHLLWHQGKLGRGNKPCVEQVRTWNGVMRYASKYLGKTFETACWSDTWTGRYWGVVNPGFIPFGRAVRMDVPSSKALEVIRYQRRFARSRSRDYPSLTILCDADQWIQKLGITGEIKPDR